MTTSAPENAHSPRQWSRRWRGSLLVPAVVTIACALFFVIGYQVGERRTEARMAAAADRRVAEFVRFVDAIGALDRRKLEEAAVTASEAEWEDRDAEERGEGGER